MESNNLGGVKHSLQFFVQLGDLNSNNITHNPDVAAGLLNSSVTFSHQGFPVPEESKGAEGDAAINLANGSSSGFVLLQDHIDTCSTKISKDLYRRFLSGKPANLSATPARRHVGISVRSAEKAEKYCEEKNPSKDVENCNAYYTVPCSSTSKTFSCLSDTGGDGSPVASVASKCVSESRFCILAKACHERTDNESPDNRGLNFPSFCSADFETRGGSFLALTTEKPSTVSLLENSEEGSTSSDNLFVLENQATQNAIVMDWSRMNATDVNNQITLPVKHNEHLQNGQENISPVVREVSVKDCFCFTESHYPALEPILFSDEQCNEERLQLDLFNTADTKLNKCTGTANSGAILNTTVVFENKSRHHQMLSDDENEEKSKSATLKEDNKKNIEIKNLSSLQVQNQELPESKHKSNQGEEFTSDLIQHSGALEKAFLLHGEETFLICSPLETNKRPVTCTSTPLPESRNMTFMLPELEDTSDYNVEFAAMNSIPESCNTTNFVSVSQMPKSSKMEFIPKSANRKPSVLANKQGKLEIMNFPKPNFKDIKPKVVSRPVAQATGNTSLGKTSPKSQSVKPNSPSPVSSPRLSSHSVKRNIREMAAKQEPPAVLQKQTGNKNRCPGQINSTKVSCKITSTRTERAVSGSKQTFPDPDKASTSGSSVSLSCPQRITNAVQYRRRKESIPMNSVLSKTEHHMADMKTRTDKLKQRHASDDTVHERSSELHATPSSAVVQECL